MRIRQSTPHSAFHRRGQLAAFGVALALQLAGDAYAAAPWPDTYPARLQALALIQTLNANILASSSATLTLEKWCGDHAMAAAAKIVARRDAATDKPAGAEQRERLAVDRDTAVKYRRVQLYCGGHLMSEADNWYVPSRLTPAMNRLLEETETPFGRAVLPLAPYRRTFAAVSLWSPLPERWESIPAATPQQSKGQALAIPAGLFEHRAVLYTREHLPFSEVHEVYQRGILEFPAPQPWNEALAPVASP